MKKKITTNFFLFKKIYPGFFLIIYLFYHVWSFHSKIWEGLTIILGFPLSFTFPWEVLKIKKDPCFWRNLWYPGLLETEKRWKGLNVEKNFRKRFFFLFISEEKKMGKKKNGKIFFLTWEKNLSKEGWISFLISIHLDSAENFL